MTPARYKEVQDALTAEIRAGKYPAGKKLPSEAALVRQFSTSRITIGRALRELTHMGLVRRVAGSGTFVTAQAAVGIVFGLLIPKLGETDIYDPICQGMSTGQTLLWGDAAGQNLEERARDYVERRVSGVFFAPVELVAGQDDLNRRVLALLDSARIPVVLIDHDALPFPRRGGHDLVGVDNRHAGYVATRHLLELHAKKIGFVGLQGSAPTVDARIAGYREALDDKGLVARDIEGACEAVEMAGCDALVCANDRTAGEVMQTLLARGYRIPDDVRLVGMDDAGYANLLPVPLTTIRQPCREIGEAAMAAMLARMEQPGMPPRDILLACRLVVRASCGW